MFESNDDLQRYAETLHRHAGIVHGLPDLQHSIALGVMRGLSVSEIAQQDGISEEAVWNMLESLTQSLEGSSPANRPETAGLGSDTDPGITGGYGDTGFGSIGNEPPYPTPEEPRDEPQLSDKTAPACEH